MFNIIHIISSSLTPITKCQKGCIVYIFILLQIAIRSDASLPQNASPCSSSLNSSVVQMRPSSLHGLGSKLSSQRYTKAGRRKSTSNIPPSPLACTSSPQALSPQRSPSPLPSISKTLHSFHGKTLSPPTIIRHVVRPRSAEPPRSPLLKRVQSAEKLSGALFADKKPHAARRHTLEVPHYEVDVPGEAETEGTCGATYTADHSRLGGYLCAQRLRDWPGERMEQIVVMRKLNLSERRDSFKKQEAVQEVSFDEPDDRAPPMPPQTSVSAGTRLKQMTGEMQSEEECLAMRNPLVPQIAVQGSESEEADAWRLCSDEDEEEVEENMNQGNRVNKDDLRSSAAAPEAAETAKPETHQSPEKRELKER